MNPVLFLRPGDYLIGVPLRQVYESEFFLLLPHISRAFSRFLFCRRPLDFFLSYRVSGPKITKLDSVSRRQQVSQLQVSAWRRKMWLKKSVLLAHIYLYSKFWLVNRQGGRTQNHSYSSQNKLQCQSMTKMKWRKDWLTFWLYICLLLLCLGKYPEYQKPTPVISTRGDCEFLFLFFFVILSTFNTNNLLKMMMSRRTVFLQAIVGCIVLATSFVPSESSTAYGVSAGKCEIPFKTIRDLQAVEIFFCWNEIIEKWIAGYSVYFSDGAN